MCCLLEAECDYSLPRLRRLDCEESPDTVTDTVSSCALSSFLLALNLLVLALIKQPHTHMTIQYKQCSFFRAFREGNFPP